MGDFNIAIQYVLANEGGLEEDLTGTDPGGITNHGLSLREYKELEFPQATADDIRNLSVDSAVVFYKKHYWLPQYNEIFSQNVCNYILDMAVNMGPAESHKIAQRSVWALSCAPQDLVDDGVLGENTLHQLNTWSNQLLAPLRAERWSFYKMLIMKNPGDSRYESGWLMRTYK